MTTQKMQKYLRLLNRRLDVVVKDMTGLTGMAIIEAICSGETNPEKLASLRHGNCRKSSGKCIFLYHPMIHACRPTPL